MGLFLSSVLLAVARNVEFWQEPFYIASHLKHYFRATREHTKVLGIPETGLHVLQFYLCSNLQLNTNNIISPASLEGKKSNAWMLLWEESAVTLFRSDLTQQSLWIPMQTFLFWLFPFKLLQLCYLFKILRLENNIYIWVWKVWTPPVCSEMYVLKTSYLLFPRHFHANKEIINS